MIKKGYYRNPTLYKDTLVFVADDALWSVPLSGGKAERLTSSTGEANDPSFSPDGKWLAFTGTYEGHPEVYLMPSEGGSAKRLTYIPEGAQVIGWASPTQIIFSSLKNSPFRLKSLFTVDLKENRVEKIPCGPANFISYNPSGPGSVIQRHGYGYVSWKRYRGGTAGELWIDLEGNGKFTKLITLKGNVLQPRWINQRIYFTSDHEGHGNIYSCTPEGTDLKRHTIHEDFFVRGLTTDQGKTFVYTAGSDLYRWNPDDTHSHKIEIEFISSFPQRARKFSDPSAYLSEYALSPHGTHMAVITRGRPFAFGNWEGAVHQYGQKDGVRYKRAAWLHDGERLVIVNQTLGDDKLEIHHVNQLKAPQYLKAMDLGVILGFTPSPTQDAVLVSNHRGELLHIDLKTQKKRVIDQDAFGDIHGFDWSPDGKWVAYDCHLDHRRRAIKLCHLKTFKTHTITQPVLQDFSPSFDPEGKYLYFISKRTFTPYYDNLHFEMGFPKGEKPYLILLQDTLASPFVPVVRSQPPVPAAQKLDKKSDKQKKKPELKIDLKGIENRILEFPIPEGDYSSIQGLPGKALYLSYSRESAAKSEQPLAAPSSKIQCYDFAAQYEDTLVPHASSYTLSNNKQWLCYHASRKLRVLKAGEKPQDADPSYRKGGWIDLNRLKVSVQPVQEWEQIFDDVWQLQKDFFWTEDMSQIDWKGIYTRYRPLLDRVATRGELTDLIAEMHGELGSSHAYVFGGDTQRPPFYPLGNLAADFQYDKTQKAYRITNIALGDRWNPAATSPLTAPGHGLTENDLLCAINGQKLTQDLSPEQLLVNQANTTVSLTVKSPKGKERLIDVRPLPSQTALRYRDWVENNRAYVHKKTKGRVGYLHIPNMSVEGFAEFHRGFLAEMDREGLIVDVRFNGGGNVSDLLLEKLSRKRLGYSQSRWWGALPYPHEAPMGPMVALTNEYAGSDGDIFSHSFKALKLGPLIGKRTWGGVIGIYMRHYLVDGGQTSQPEFSPWFYEAGWGIENYGVDPDIEVEITPQDYVEGKDSQLDRGIEEVLKIIKTSPPTPLFTTERPNLAPPKLKKKKD